MSLRIAAIAPLASLAILLTTGPIAYADANPRNHGHHYGQLKHHKIPPPRPTPAPAPKPVAAPPPVAAAIARPAIVSQHTSDPAATGPTSTVAPSSPLGDRLQTSESGAASADLEWLLLLVLPLLLVVWLIALTRLAAHGARRTSKAQVVRTATV